MNNFLLKTLCLLCFFIFIPKTEGQSINLQGFVTAIDSKEPLIGVIIQDTLSGEATITDGYGFYALTLSSTYTCLNIEYTGYVSQLICREFNSKEPFNLSLVQLSQIEEITVLSSSFNQKINSLNQGVSSIPIQLIESLPHIGGESDILKALTLMPGLAQGVEGTTGFFIRGGSPDQNLILIDDAPVYNVSHFGPLLSVFNTDAVKHIKVTKGSLPAQYGGRLAGLTDIRTKEGNLLKWGGKFSISPVSGRFLLEGPIKKDKTAFFLSSRSSWFGLLLKLASTEEVSQSYTMYDINTKISHHINDRHRIFFSLYNGLDDTNFTELTRNIRNPNGGRYLELNDIITTNWGNLTSSIRYIALFSNNWSAQTIVYYTKYKYNSSQTVSGILETGEDVYSKEGTSSFNRDVGGKVVVSKYHKKYTLKIGTEQIEQLFSPENTFVLGTNSVSLKRSDKAYNHSYFVNTDFFPENKISFGIGLRNSNFQLSSKTYSSLEPRLSIRYRVSPDLSWKLGWHSARQFIHLLTGGNTGLTNEVWVGSNENIAPQRGWQLASSMNWDVASKNINVELGGFYKKMNNLIDFKQGSSGLFDLANWEDIITTGGRGRVGGLEFIVQKPNGKISGWLAYTLSWNERQFDAINKGDWYPFRFDRRNDISLVGQLSLGRHWKMSLTWLYQTGIAVTLPSSIIPIHPNIPGSSTSVIDQRNNARLPAYHRADLSFVKSWISKKSKREKSLAFSIYNVYNRINPFSLTTMAEPIFQNGSYVGSSPPKVFVTSLFPFLPSISYSTHFSFNK